jgi:hypothetical protein
LSEKWWVWNGVHSASLAQLRSYLEIKVAAPVWKSENTAVGIRHADCVALSIHKFGTKLADKRRSLGRYSSLADSDHGVSFFIFLMWVNEYPSLLFGRVTTRKTKT